MGLCGKSSKISNYDFVGRDERSGRPYFSITSIGKTFLEGDY